VLNKHRNAAVIWTTTYNKARKATTVV